MKSASKNDSSYNFPIINAFPINLAWDLIKIVVIFWFFIYKASLQQHGSHEMFSVGTLKRMPNDI